jgi:hypothetical protein
MMLSLAMALAVLAAPVYAQNESWSTTIRSLQEVPALDTPAGGTFVATLNEAGTEISWELKYVRFAGDVTQAHIHFAQQGVNGGIMVFFCSNLGNGPVGTQACPPSPGVVRGTWNASDVGAGAAAQGISAGDFRGLLRSLRTGISYVNVHTTLFPGGEARGQVAPRLTN